MVLPKREDGFFPKREDLLLLEVTAETGLWYGLLRNGNKMLRMIMSKALVEFY